jgi:polysaccharide pyruvyl transferase WcaK-like protein
LRVAILMFFIWLARVPLLIYGVTGFPVKSWFGRTVFKWMGNHAQEIVTRDAGAYKSLSDIGVRTPMQQGVDLRAVLDPAPRKRVDEILRGEGIDTEKPMIGLTVRYIHKGVPNWVKSHLDMSADSIDRSNEALGKVAAELGKSAQVFIIGMNADLEEDIAVAENIRKYMDDPSRLKVIRHRYLATETLGIIKACDLLIAGRVGSAFFATMLGTPLIAIAHEGRMVDWMQEIGMLEYMFDWQSLNSAKILKQIEKLNASREEIAKSFRAIGESARKQAWQDAEAYKKYLLG